MAALSGIASGVDTDAIVAKLMDAESGRRKRMDWTQAQISARSTGLGSVQTKLLALRSSLQGLRDVGTWADTQSVASSSPGVTVRRTGGAGAGGYQLDVLALARAEQRSYDYAASGSATTLTVGSTSIPIAAGASLADVVSAVNGAGAPVYAAAAGGKLVLSARTTGTTSAFAATGDTITEDATRARAGADARYRLDGGAEQTSSSNVVADALPGLELTLKAVTSQATITVGAPGVDVDVVTAKVQAFVDAYNDTVKTTRSLLSEDRVPGATSAASYAQGALRADSGLNALLGGLRGAAMDPVAGNASALDELRELGVSTGAASAVTSADARAGLLVLDTDKLRTALADPQAARRLLGGITGVDGFAQRMEGVVGGQLGSRGILTQRLGEAASATTTLQATMTREDQRLAAVEKRYKAQFTAMEVALANAQAQQSWLAGQIAQLG